MITPHHYRSGGCQHACFSADGQKVITVGNDKTISCWEWRYLSQSLLSLAMIINTLV